MADEVTKDEAAKPEGEDAASDASANAQGAGDQGEKAAEGAAE